MKTVTIKKTVTEEIQIDGDFPVFFKDSIKVAKVLSESEFISIRTYKTTCQKALIEHISHSTICGELLSEGTPITKAEFLAEFEKAKSDFNALIY